MPSFMRRQGPRPLPVLLLGTLCATTAVRLFHSVAFTGAAGSHLVPAARSTRTEAHFFNKIAKFFGGQSPQDEAKAELLALEAPHAAEVKANRALMKTERSNTQALISKLEKALVELRSARSVAMAASTEGWQEPEDAWDASLASLAAPVVEKAAAVRAVVGELGAAADQLAASCKQAQKASAARQAAADAIVAKLQPEERGSVVSVAASVAKPLSDDGLLRSWVLASAEATDGKRLSVSASQEAEKVAELPAVLVEQRQKRAKEEALKAERAAAAAKAAQEAAAAAAAKASATSARQASTEVSAPAEESNFGGLILGLVALVVIGAGAYLYSTGAIDPSTLGSLTSSLQSAAPPVTIEQ